MILENIKEVYAHLHDDISQKLFMARLEYFISGNAGAISMLPAEYRSLNSDIEMFRQKFLAENFDRTVIFGAGENGTAMARLFPKRIEAFIDNYRNGLTEKKTKLPILSLQDCLEKYDKDHTKFIISVSDRNIEHTMREQLIKAGVKDRAIVGLNGEYRNNAAQYFDVLEPEEHECFVDCGCFDGSTSFRFAGWCGKKGYDKIWCFEPDHQSYTACKEICKKLDKCELFPYGVSDIEERVSFVSTGREDARIREEEVVNNDINVVKTIVLDKFLEKERITFIKMDIEGFEMRALKGAANIIKEQKPKLAISIYHKPGDFVEIPALLLKLRPDYQFYIRHYSLLLNETVLYAF